MTAPISKLTAPHYLWREVCDGWRLVDQENLSVIEERVPAGASESAHYHKIARQFFYVLQGVAVMEVEGTEHEISAGSGLEVAPGQRHRFMNKGTTEVCFLVISSPRTAEDRYDVETGSV